MRQALHVCEGEEEACSMRGGYMGRGGASGAIEGGGMEGVGGRGRHRFKGSMER